MRRVRVGEVSVGWSCSGSERVKTEQRTAQRAAVANGGRMLVAAEAEETGLRAWGDADGYACARNQGQIGT